MPHERDPLPWSVDPESSACILDAEGADVLIAPDGRTAALIVRAVNSHEAMKEALRMVTNLLNDPGVGDLEQWKRDCREWTAKSRALLEER